MVNRIILLVFLLTPFLLGAQEDIVFRDHVYLDHIRSVRLHHEGLETSLPIIDFNSSGKLVLSFDDILGGDINYRYKLIHCDRNWNPSNLDDSEYLDGFNEEEIRNFEYSIGTKTDYTHYELELPNRDISWRYSGNYLLLVWDEDNGETALTKRIMVVEPRVTVLGEVRRSISAVRLYSHQELSISINNKNFPIQNPQRDLSVSILQNGRWDNMQTDIQPKFSQGYTIEFDRTQPVSFEGLNEFRGIDIRNLRSRAFGVHSIDVLADRIRVVSELDNSRSNRAYIDIRDIDGSYSIESMEYPGNNKSRPEYVEVLFSLYHRDLFMNADVYVTGAFSEWELKPEWKMDYNYDKQFYFTSGILKQGYYDYQFVLAPDRGNPDFTYFEGSHAETNNNYTVLVYYKSFADRYDRLIAVKNLSSNL